ncbi:MAG: metallophosphoesterase family protein [Candidatus Limivicinus sp.]|nr:metallophosphoesterase family protein [Candidatus Limivicinus sp.]
MKILLVSDEEDRFLWDYYTPGRLKGIDLILSAGDLKAEYLSFLVTMANRPLLYVHGNHDGGYAQRPPEGCQCIDGKLVTVGGLRILGLGGSALYNGGPHQYTEKQMRRRIHRLRLKLALAGGVDIVLTHAPVRGFGDEDNMTHRGFEAFLPLLDQYQPRYLVHGHIHQRYGANRPRCQQYGETTIINATGRYILEFPDKPNN